jgi:phosphoserine phosphatase
MIPLSSYDGAAVPVPTGRVALLLDADRTLASIDTGRAVGEAFGANDRIRAIFRELGYSPSAFARVAGVWSEVPVDDFLAVSERVAEDVVIAHAWQHVLGLLPAGVGAAIITAGIPGVWRSALHRYGLGHIPVLGGCHAALDRYYVTPGCKAFVVGRWAAAAVRVIAAGDSEIDIPMLQRADLALFVADVKGSPRMLARLSEIPGVVHLATDERRFPGIPSIVATDLLARIHALSGYDHAIGS